MRKLKMVTHYELNEIMDKLIGTTVEFHITGTDFFTSGMVDVSTNGNVV